LYLEADDLGRMPFEWRGILAGW